MADQPRRPSGLIRWRIEKQIAAEREQQRERNRKISKALDLISSIRRAKRKKRKTEEEEDDEEKGSNAKNSEDKNKKDGPRQKKVGKVEEKKEEDKGRKGKKRKKEDEEPEALVKSKAELDELCDELARERSIQIDQDYDDSLELIRQLKAKGFSGSVEIDLPDRSEAADAFKFCVDQGLTAIPSPRTVPQPSSSQEIPTPVHPPSAPRHDPDFSQRRKND